MGLRPSGSSVIDASVLGALRELANPGEPDALTEVVQLFLGDVPIQLAALRKAIKRADAASVRQFAHQLRGSALAIGATGMAGVCVVIEEGARGHALQQVGDDVDRLDREFALVRRELEQALR